MISATSFMLASGGPEPPSDRIRVLADLHRDGLLTDDEYSAKRADAVERL